MALINDKLSRRKSTGGGAQRAGLVEIMGNYGGKRFYSHVNDGYNGHVNYFTTGRTMFEFEVTNWFVIVDIMSFLLVVEVWSCFE